MVTGGAHAASTLEGRTEHGNNNGNTPNPKQGSDAFHPPPTPNGADQSNAMPRRPRLVAAPRRHEPRILPDLTGKTEVHGSHVGDRYVRVVRQTGEEFQRVAPGYLVATEQAHESRGAVGRSWQRAKRILIGAPLTTAAAAHERLTKLKALAVLSSDALSSVAYATEEILRILLLAGFAALSLSLPIGAGIVA